VDLYWNLQGFMIFVVYLCKKLLTWWEFHVIKNEVPAALAFKFLHIA
jgi:hypothetical protein